MKMVKLWILLLLAEAACVFLIVSGSSTHGGRQYPEEINRDNMKLEDYLPIDPVPSPSAATTSGPIEHSTPLMPYIPKLTPPESPQHDGSLLPPSPG